MRRVRGRARTPLKRPGLGPVRASNRLPPHASPPLSFSAGDWLQGPYVYALYQHYGFNRGDIGRLFIAGFASSMVFGTIVGSLADRTCVFLCFRKMGGVGEGSARARGVHCTHIPTFAMPGQTGCLADGTGSEAVRGVRGVARRTRKEKRGGACRSLPLSALSSPPPL